MRQEEVIRERERKRKKSNVAQQQNAKQHSSLLGNVARTAAMMIGFGIGMKVFRGLGFKANVMVGRIASDAFNTKRPLGRIVKKLAEVGTKAVQMRPKHGAPAKWIQRPQYAKWYQRLSKTVRKSMLHITKGQQKGTVETMSQAIKRVNAERPMALTDKFRQRIDTLDAKSVQAIRQRYKGKNDKFMTKMLRSGVAKDTRLSSIIRHSEPFRKSPVGALLQQFRSHSHKYLAKTPAALFAPLAPNAPLSAKVGGKDFGKAMMGRMYRWGADIASVAAFDYGMWRMMARDDKKWYDPSAVGEWLGFELTGGAVMRGAMILPGTLGPKIAQKVIKSIPSKDVNSVIKKSLAFSESIGKSAPIVALQRARKLASREITGMPKNVKRIGKYLNKWTETFSKTRHQYRKDPKKFIQPSGLEQSLQDARKHLEAYGTKEKSKLGELKKTIRQNLNDTYGKQDPNKWTRGLNLALNDAKISAQISSTKMDISNNTMAKRLGISKKKAMLHKGHGHVSYDDRDYDISSIMPRNILRGAARTITSSGHPLVSLLGARFFSNIDDDTFIKKYGPGTIMRLGKSYDLQDTEQLLKSYGEIEGPVARNAAIQLQDDKKMINEILDSRFKRYKTPHDPRNTNAQRARDQAQAQMAHGHLKLEGDEEGWYIGKKLYMRKGEKVYQLGYDAKKGTFLNFNIISKEKGGEFNRIYSDYFGLGSEYTIKDISGKTRKVTSMGGGRVQKVMDDTMPEIFKPVKNVLDRLEIGPKRNQGVLGTIANYSKRWKDPSISNRTLLSDQWLFNNEYFSRVQKDTAKVFGTLGKLDAVADEANVLLVSKVLKNDNVIDGIQQQMKKSKSKYINHIIDIDDNPDIAAKKVKMFRSTIGGKDVNPRIEQILTDMEGLTSPTIGEAFGGEYRKVGAHSISELDAYNSLIYRNFLKGNDFEELNSLVSHMQNVPGYKRGQRNRHLLEMTRMISEFDEIPARAPNIREATIGLKVAQDHLVRTRDWMKSNRDVIEEFGRMTEPAWKPNNINSAYIGGSRNMSDIFLATPDKGGEEGAVRLLDKWFPRTKQIEDYQIAAGPLTTEGMATLGTVNAINNVANVMGIGFDDKSIRTVNAFAGNVITKRILPAAALALAWQGADAVFDESGLFEKTSLGEGLNVFVGKQFVQGRLAMARINDMLGITSTANYLEDLMPGFVTSPMAGAVRGLGSPIIGLTLGAQFGGPRGALTGGAIGGTISLLTAGGPMAMVGQYDLTKDRKELIEEFSGRKDVPVFKGANWLVGFGPLAGSGVEYFRPNWFASLRAQSKYTDVAFGGKFERLVNAANPSHYFNKHKYTRAYPYIGGAFDHVPLIGEMLTFGGKMASDEDMQYAGLANSFNQEESYVNVGGTNPQTLMGHAAGINTGGTMFDASIGRDTADMTGNFMGGFDGTPQQYSQPVAPTHMAARMARASYGLGTELPGLRGFISASLIQNMNNGLMPFEDAPIYQSASWMSSPVKEFWDMDAGDMIGSTEFLRRFIPKKGQNVNEINPMINASPDWLPGSEHFTNFSTGDPYNKVKRGEQRLPGQGYEAIRDVKFNFPLDTSYLGMKRYDQVALLTGNHLPVSPDERFDKILRGPVVRRMSANISAQNENIRTNVNVYNPWMDISGTADIQTGNTFVNVKPVSAATFEGLSGPIGKHKSEMNALLTMGRKQAGTIVYINAESGESKSFDIMGNQELFQKDMLALQEAKATSNQLVTAQGPSIGASMATAYSRIDRLRILGDVAPYSSKFKQTLNELKALNNIGSLDPRDQEILQETLDQIEKKQERYTTSERKFTRGTPVDEEEREHQRQIKEKYSGIERAMGSGWEAFSHMQTPIHRKMLNQISPLEAYERLEVHGQCLDGDTEILTYNGELTKIKDIVVGDMVTGLDGKWHPVTATFERTIKTTDTLVELKSSTGHTITVTSNHMIPILQENSELVDTKAGDISQGDYMVYPMINPVHKSEPHLKEIPWAKYILAGSKAQTNAIPITDGNRILLAYKERPNTVPSIRRNISMPSRTNVTYDLYYLFGLFLAEGHIHRKKHNGNIIGIGFTFHINETNLADAVVNIMSNRLDLNCSVYTNKSKNQRTVVCLNPLIGMAFLELFGQNAQSKKIPAEITNVLPINIVKLIEGYNDGDGYHNAAQRITIGSVSKQLLSHIQLLIGGLGCWGLIFKCKPSTKNALNSYTLKLNKTSSSKLRKMFKAKMILCKNIDTEIKSLRGKKVFNDDQYIYTKVIEVNKKTIIPNMLLYDIEIDDGHYFNTLCGIVHNSMKMWDAPYRDFIRPYVSDAFNKTGPIEGGISFSTGGFLLGGAPGAAIAGSIGAAWGAFNSSSQVPAYRQRQRELTQELDAIRYEKAKQQYEETHDPKALTEMKKTMTWRYANSKTLNQFKAATPKAERAFMDYFMNARTVEEREKILQLTPKYIHPIIQSAWSGNSIDENPMEGIQVPGGAWEGWDPQVKTDDIAVKVFQNECISADQRLFNWHRFNKAKNLSKQPLIDGNGDIVKPISTHIRHYNGQILRIKLKGNYNDTIITDNHIVSVKKRNCNKIKGKRTFQEMPISNIQEYDKVKVPALNIKTKVRSITIGDIDVNLNHAFGIFVGLFVAEGSYIKKDRLTKDSVTPRRSKINQKLNLILYTLKTHNNKMTIKEISKHVTISRPSLSRYLNMLLDDGLVDKTRSARGKLKTVTLLTGNTNYYDTVVSYHKKRTGIQLGFHVKERYFVEKYIKPIADIFKANVNVYRIKGKLGINVMIHSSKLTEYLYSIVGEYSHSKNLAPCILEYPVEFIRGLLHGHYIGDGYTYTNKFKSTTYSVSTVSECLANQVWMLLRTFGIESKLYKQEYRNKQKRTGYTVAFSRKQSIKLFDSKVWKKALYTEITVDSVIPENYNGDVYDFTMPKDHHYVAGAMLIHNSLNARDIGLGWQSQIRRLSYTTGVPDSITVGGGAVQASASSIETLLRSIVGNKGNIRIVRTQTQGIDVNVTVTSTKMTNKTNTLRRKFAS